MPLLTHYSQDCFVEIDTFRNVIPSSSKFLFIRNSHFFVGIYPTAEKFVLISFQVLVDFYSVVLDFSNFRKSFSFLLFL